MKYIKKFESFGTKELSNVYKAAIENRFVTLDSVHDSSTETAPVTAPPKPDTPIPSKPPLPFMPTKKPKPGTEERPMGTFEEVMSIFFSELNKIKDTSKGQEMLKNIENKYGNL